MDSRLRPRKRASFTGFTHAEIEKMEKSLKESGENCTDDEFCKTLTQGFNRSNGRAGKPLLKWIEVQTWFKNRQTDRPSEDTQLICSNEVADVLEAVPLKQVNESIHMSKGEKTPDLSELEFEARSSKDRAWFDVDTFLTHRTLSTGEAEVLVRFVGFGPEEDEWVNVKNDVRERSVPVESSECHTVKVEDLVVCFQESKIQAKYYDAHVLEIRRRVHDIRGCRCVFLIRYDHDNTEERVGLRRLCCRPTQ